MATRAEAEAELTGPGQPFEITTETVNGWPGIPVYRERMRSMRELFAMGAGHGDKTFLVHGERRWSFARFAADANTLAHALSERYGVERGDRVAMLGANSPEWALTFWATVNAGAVAVGLNGWWKADELLHALALTKPKVLVVDEARLARFPAPPPVEHVVVMERDLAGVLAHRHDAPPTAEIAEDDPAVIFFTSGTTGRAKGVVSTHRGMVANVQNVFLTGLAMLRAAGDDVIAGNKAKGAGEAATLLTSPMFHVSGCHSGMVLGWVTGQKHVLPVGKVTADQVMRLIEAERITFWPAVPTLVWRVVQHPDRHRYDLSTVTRVAYGGAPASPELFEQSKETFLNLTTNFGTGWGLTETTSAVTSNSGPEYMARPTSVGRPFPIVELRVVGDDGAPLTAGETGEILVRGCQVTPGYWDDPAATASAIDAAGWFRTGDVGHLDTDGFLHLTDRAKDMILRGGENVSSVEIEHRLVAHPHVLDAAVIPVAHPVLGEEVKAVVQVADGAVLTADELRAWCAETLADFKVPTYVDMRAGALPRNASGKLLKAVLRGEAADVRAESWER